MAITTKRKNKYFVVRTEADSTAHAIELIEPDCRGTARAVPMIPRVLLIKGLGAGHVWYYRRAQPLLQVHLVENTPCIQLASRRCIDYMMRSWAKSHGRNGGRGSSG